MGPPYEESTDAEDYEEPYGCVRALCRTRGIGLPVLSVGRTTLREYSEAVPIELVWMAASCRTSATVILRRAFPSEEGR